MAISFDSIGERYVTFTAGTGAETGAVCKMTGNGTVGACSAGDSFCGVAAEVKDGLAAVVLAGFVELGYTGTAPSVGYGILAADGAGKVKTATTGRSCLIVSVDTTAKTVGLFL